MGLFASVTSRIYLSGLFECAKIGSGIFASATLRILRSGLFEWAKIRCGCFCKCHITNFIFWPFEYAKICCGCFYKCHSTNFAFWPFLVSQNMFRLLLKVPQHEFRFVALSIQPQRLMFNFFRSMNVLGLWA